MRAERTRRHRLLPALVLGLLALALPQAARALSDTFVSIGTGAADGVYYPIGRGLCRIVNLEREAHGLRCSVEATPGSVYNARMLADGQLEFAILQGDVLHGATRGAAAWTAGPMPPLRAVMPLHPEIVTLVADGRMGIAAPTDLAGRSVNAGHPGSGTRSSFEALAGPLGLGSGPGRPSELRTSALPDALCSGQIAAFSEVVGHPSGLVRTVRERCGAVLVPLAEPVIGRLIEAQPHLRRLMIPGALYGLTADVPSVGSHAVLVARADLGEDVVHLVTSRLLAAADELRTLHPTLRDLDLRALAKTELAAGPLHPGAERAYREHGLLP